jgi:hypothetical protein
MKKLAILLTVALIMSILPMGAVSANSVGPSWVWGIDPSSAGEELVLLDAWTGTEYARLALPDISSSDTELALAGGSDKLFYVNSDYDEEKVYVLDPTDGSTTSTVWLTGDYEVDGIGYYGGGGGYLYTSGCAVDDLHRYSAAGGDPTYYWSDSVDPQAVGGDDTGRIFTTSYNGTHHNIIEVDPLTDVAALNTFAPPTQDIVGMAYDGTNLYVSDTNDMLYILDPDDGEVLNSLDLGFNLYALAISAAMPPAIVSDKFIFEQIDHGDGDGIIEVGEEWQFNVVIVVVNVSPEEITEILLKDNLGGDIKINRVIWPGSGGWVVVPQPTEKKKQDNQTTIGPFTVEWTGKTKKAHLYFDVGTLAAGESSGVYQLDITTDINPGGKQEWTSEGPTELNSGATAKGLLGGLYEVESVSEPLEVVVQPLDLD